MQTASAPFLLRALCKDDVTAESQLSQPATELLTNVFGAQRVNRHDALIAPAARGLYTFSSMLMGQTIGEEFCDLLAVTKGQPWRSVGVTRIALLALLQAAEPSALFALGKIVFPNLAPHDFVANVSRVVRCLAFLFERYATLPHRLLSIRFLSLKPSRSLPDSEGAPGSYFVLGLLLLVELVVRLARYSKQRAAEKAKEKAALAAGKKSESSELSSSDEENEVSGKCMLCLSHRKCPTATQCGHVFCWRCIADWIKSNPKDALCPFCRQRITLPTLVPLYFYVAKEAPRVGTADAD